jgi:hypothetical protein
MSASAAACGAEGGEKVQLERRLEVGVGDAHEAVDARMHAADVVDEHVDAPVYLDRVCDEPRRPVGVEEVDRVGAHAVYPVERLGATSTSHDEGSFARELTHHGQSDALARAGDDRDLVAQFQIHDRDPTRGSKTRQGHLSRSHPGAAPDTKRGVVDRYRLARVEWRTPRGNAGSA